MNRARNEGRRRGGGGRAVVAALTVLLLAASGSACRKAGISPEELRVAIANAPATLDPRLATDAEGDKISALVCDGLMLRDANLEMVPGIAERFERLSDTSYRFFLRPGVLFSDGTMLTAEDVAFTYRSITDGSIASPYKGIFDRIKAIDVESPEVLRIDLKEPYAPFITTLSRGIVSKSAALSAKKRFGERPVCAGPYAVKAFSPDLSVELVANEQYYGSQPKTRALTFHVVKDDNIRVLKLLKGDIDLVQNGIPPILIKDLLASSKLRLVQDVGTVIAYLGFNLADPALKDPRVRRAIALAIDRDEIIAHRFRGMAEKANSILSPRNWAYDEGLPQIATDPAQAAALLDAAGLRDPDGDGPKARFGLTYKTSTVKERVDLARMIAAQLARVGIAVRVTPYEWGTFYKDIRSGNFQVYALSWVGVADPDIFYEVYHSDQAPPQGLNRGRYRNERVDRLVEAGRREMDRRKRRAIYAEVQRILLEELPIVPLWYENNVTVYRGDLEGVSVRPDASYRVFTEVEKQ